MLSEEGKRQRLTQAYLKLIDATRRRQEEHEREIEAERQSLEKRLLGPPRLGYNASAADRYARDLSFRDALDRAARTKGPELATFSAVPSAPPTPFSSVPPSRRPSTSGRRHPESLRRGASV